jgi:hypothetical protein
MHFKREVPPARFNTIGQEAFWLRDDKDQVISFRDKEAAEHFLRMVEESEAFHRVLPLVQSADLQTHLSEFDNNGYVIQLTVSRTVITDSGVILLSTRHH